MMPDDAAEIWKAVVGYEGLYDVSNLGRVRRVGRAAKIGKGFGGGARVGRIIKDQLAPPNYRTVQLWKDGVPANFLVHQLVTRAFIGPPPSKHEVNHDDGKKPNNHLNHGVSEDERCSI